MKNTCTRSILYLSLLLILLISTQVWSFESNVKLRIYRKALQEIIEKNWPLLSEYAQYDIGIVDLTSITMTDTTVRLYPAELEGELEAYLEFVPNEGIQLSLNEFKIEAKGKIGEVDSVLTADIDTMKSKITVKEVKQDANQPNSYNIPQFKLDKFDVELNKDSIELLVGDESKINDELRDTAAIQFDNQIQGLKIVLETALNLGQSQMTDYVTENLDIESQDQDITMSVIEFYENYIELGIGIGFEPEEGDYKLRKTSDLSEQAGDKTKAVEIAIDENILNTGLYTLYIKNKGFALREILRINEEDNEYGPMFDQVLKTNVLGQGWKEMEDEFGPDKDVDAECSFGKELFKDVIKDIKPSSVRFLKGSQIDISLGFGCSVKIKNEEGEYKNFRSFYGELYAKLKLDITSNDASKRIKVDGDVLKLSSSRIKIFKLDEPMIAEETAMLMMVNMGLNMLKSQISQALQIPQVGYPSIKECTGLTVLRPSIDIYDGFLVISTDLDVKAAEKGCDLFEPASFESSDPTDVLGNPEQAFEENLKSRNINPDPKPIPVKEDSDEQIIDDL